MLMAGNISATVAGQTLRLAGDDVANGVAIVYDGSAKTYHVSGLDAAGEPTRINGQDTSTGAIPFRRVSRVIIETRGGDDIIDLGSGNIRIATHLTIDTGAGNDTVTLGRAGNEADLNNLPAQLRTGGSVNVALGEGNDSLDLANMIVGTHLRLDAGAGDDQINFDTEFVVPADGSNPERTLVSAVKVFGSVTADLGAGLDELDARHVAINGRLQIVDAAGPTEIDLFNLKVGTRVDITTGDDIDLIALDLVLTQGLTINAKGGADEVILDNSRFRTANVQLGAGFDDLAIANTRVNDRTLLDGGEDSGLFTNGPGNVLKRLTKRRLETA
jgi:hypothetical protein